MKTEICEITDISQFNSVIEYAHKLLSEGKIVVFPTETVYGVAARADIDSGWNKLTEIKQRPENKPFTIHVGNKNDIYSFVPNISFFEKKIVKKFLPGPLTLVFSLDDEQIQIAKQYFTPALFERLYFDNSIGIRLPDEKLALPFLSNSEGPIVASSANPAGMPPAYTADKAKQYLDGKVDLIIDNGPSRIQKPSTIIKLSNNHYDILRQGVIDNRMIEKALKMNILFVCTGNTCRSPMAEGFGRSIAAKKNQCNIDQLKKNGYHISSAGVMAIDGHPASPEAVVACQSRGVDISGHRSKLISREMINSADYILAMSEAHYNTILSIAPDAAAKTRMLDPKGIADPIGNTQDIYDKCAQQIHDAIESFFDNLESE